MLVPMELAQEEILISAVDMQNRKAGRLWSCTAEVQRFSWQPVSWPGLLNGSYSYEAFHVRNKMRISYVNLHISIMMNAYSSNILKCVLGEGSRAFTTMKNAKSLATDVNRAICTKKK